MGPGTSGTRLFGKGHQYLKSKGRCYLSKMSEWCHTGSQEFLETAVRGRHAFCLDLGTWFFELNGQPSLVALHLPRNPHPKGQSSIAYGQFVSLEVTPEGLVPRAAPVDITSKHKDAATEQTAGMNAANAQLQTAVQTHVAELSRNSGRTVDLQRYDQYVASLGLHGPPILAHNTANPQLGARDRHFRLHQRFWMSQVNRVLALDDAFHLQDHVDQLRRRSIGPWTEERYAQAYDEARTFLSAHPEVNAPLLIIGNPTFGPQTRRGTIGCPKTFVKMMSRYFFVVIVDEYKSSQVSLVSVAASETAA